MTDYMKEAERLIAAHESAIRQHDRGAEWDEGPAKTLAALLTHIQRGAVPEGWQVVPSADQLWNNDEVMALNAELGLTMDQLSRLASAITRIAHPADWRERFSQAVYDDLAAADNQDFPLEEYPARILKVLDAVIGREIKPAPAEVPMPEEIGWVCWNGTRIGDDPPHFCTYEPTAHQLRERVTLLPAAISYGDAREAAGYAWGREEAGRDAERYQWLCNVATEQQWVELGGYTLTNTIDDYIDAAMRGEECDLPPRGWRCTREKGHEGPCATVECPWEIEIVERAMKRLRGEVKP